MDASTRAVTMAYLAAGVVGMLLPVIFMVFQREASPYDSVVRKCRRNVRGWWYGLWFMTLFFAGLGVPLTWATLRDGNVGQAVVVVMFWLACLWVLCLGGIMLAQAHRQLREAKRQAQEAPHDATWLQQARQLADAMRTVMADAERRRPNP